MKPTVTIEDLVSAITESARSEEEIIATVVYMVNSGAVRLAGDLEGATFDLRELPAISAAA